MELWIHWFQCVHALRQACSRTRTFMWMTLVLIGFSIRSELLGVTSFVRACFINPEKYRNFLHLFHTTGLNLEGLTAAWIRLVLSRFTPVTCGEYAVLIADGLKIPKEGRKMPAVKCVHQESENNSKPEFIMGHSFQALGMLVKGSLGDLFCVPLVSRIHEGLVWSNRDKRTLLDKLVALFLQIVSVMQRKCILLADAYYASRKVIKPLLAEGHHLGRGGESEEDQRSMEGRSNCGTSGRGRRTSSRPPAPSTARKASPSATFPWTCCGVPLAHWSASSWLTTRREGG
jgi:hypothetical protein